MHLTLEWFIGLIYVTFCAGNVVVRGSLHVGLWFAWLVALLFIAYALFVLVRCERRSKDSAT